MAQLTGSTISTTYDMLLKTATTGGITSDLKVIEDGLGVDSALQLSSTTVKVAGTLHTVDGTPTFEHTTSNLQVDFISADASNILNFTNGEAGYDVLRTNAGLRFDTGGSEARMRIDSSGRVGIGGTPSTYNLEVHDSSDSTISVVAGATSKASLYLGDAVATRGRVEYDNDEGGSTPDSLSLWSNNARAITIDNSQNVGIGGTAGNKLHVICDDDDGIRISAGTAAAHGDKNARIYALNTAGTFYNDLELRASETRIYSDGATAMTIDSSGNVGIGGTPSTDTRLHVKDAGELTFKGNAGDAELYIKNNTAIDNMAGTASLVFAQGLNSNGGKIVSGRDEDYETSAKRSSYMAFYTSLDADDTERMRIDSSGNVGIGTAAAGRDADLALEVAGTFGVDEYIYHNGDHDTYMRFGGDEWEVVAGATSEIKVDGGNILLPNLPTADPAVAGALYSDGATSAGVPKALMISGG